MPHLQIDVGAKYPVAVKRELARRMGNTYAEIMQTTPDLVDVTIRDLGEGSVWHTGTGDPQPAAVVTLEIRRGRPPEQRAKLASAMVDLCAGALGLNPELVPVEFTQHAGDEIYRKAYIDGVLTGGLGRDWTPDEVNNPLLARMKEEARRKAS
jgi:phenylpyruvate tautomerase PptA (4-oxalocrotonate tautomerase family)